MNLFNLVISIVYEYRLEPVPLLFLRPDLVYFRTHYEIGFPRISCAHTTSGPAEAILKRTIIIAIPAN